MIEKTVAVTTADGRMETFVVRPDAPGPHPVVLLYMDAFGIRKELRDMVRLIATVGYFTLLPNLFYRAGAISFDSSSLPDRVDPRMQELNFATTMAMVAGDTRALLDHFAADPAASDGPKGCIGFCMGGRHACTAAGTFTDDFRAAASIHGGYLVTDARDSAHQLIANVRGGIYFAFADADPSAPPEQADCIRDLLVEHHVDGAVELFPGALHGFAFPKRYCYDKRAADQVWHRWFELLRRHVGP